MATWVASEGLLLALAIALMHVGACAAWRGVVEPHTMSEPWQYDEPARQPASGSGSGPPATPHPYPNGTSFSGIVGNRAVLQRGADTAAVVFGRVAGGVTASASVGVTVTEVGVGSYTVAATVVTLDLGGGNLTWRAALKPHPSYGGSVSLTAQCKGCSNTTAATVEDVTYGDVWFCSGQSNMELPMAHALTRNRTYRALDHLGMYQNIRTFKNGIHTALDDRDVGSNYVTPPPPPPLGNYDGTGAPSVNYGWVLPNSSTTAEFSAACWFFAQELTDIAVDKNTTAPVIGLIQSSWGGTQIESWQRNDTIANCKNASGTGPQNPVRAGAIWNGMIAPFINYTIFGVLWYQGENNVHGCVGAAGHGAGGQDVPIDSCGNSLQGTGYACSMKNLVAGWRKQWSVAKGTTEDTFPFGIVSLAAGTSEGHGAAMPAFRHAQTASYGMLPGPVGSGMEKTFVAQGYDAGDPGSRYQGDKRHAWANLDSPYQAQYDAPFPGRSGYSAGGIQEFTPQYMGGLHPRAKQTIGRRLALAAANVAYGMADVPFTGPVIKTCAVLKANAMCAPGQDPDSPRCRSPHATGINQRQITLNFNEELLGPDAVKVWPTAPDTEGLVMTALYNCLDGACLSECHDGNTTCAEACVLRHPRCSGWAAQPMGPAANGFNPTQYDANHFRWRTGKSVSPLEVELNHSIWMPAAISFNAGNTGGPPLNTNWTKVQGWSSVVAQAPVSIPIGCGKGIDARSGAWMPCPPASQLNPGEWCENCTAHFRITGVRYAWTESPCGGGNAGGSTNTIPLPVNSCPISTWNSTLPAVPFSAKIVYTNDTGLGVGRCVCTPPQVCD